MHPRTLIYSFCLAAGLLIMACSPTGGTLPPSPTNAATHSGQLTPYIAPSATRTVQPPDSTTPTPLPSPTATPRVHEVQKGEDLFGISLVYGVPLEEIIAANPTVNPRAMSIGTELIIPAALTPQPAAADAAAGGLAAAQLTPTPLPVESGALNCTRARDGGIWCFQLIRNPHDYALEGLTSTFRLAESSGEAIFSQTAFLPLDTLAPGAALPLSSYFAPEVAANLGESFQASSELIAALPNPNDGRYLRSKLQNQKVVISANGLSAEVSLDVLLDQPESRAGRVWVAATAYDAAGSVVGVRRWEENDASLESSQALPVTLHIYSVSGTISRVELISEVRP